MTFILLLHWMTALIYPAYYEINLDSYDGLKRDIIVEMTPRYGATTKVVMHVTANAHPGVVVDLLKSGGEDNGWKVTVDLKNELIIRVSLTDESPLRSLRFISKDWNPVIKPIFPDPPKN